MKWYKHIIRRVLNGIILFLLPLILLLIIMGKAVDLVQKLIAPIKKHLPAEHILGFGLLTLISLVIIILVCYIAGILVEKKGMKMILKKIEDNILILIPGYAMIKSRASDVLGDSDDQWQTVMVGDGEDGKIGILVEHQPDGFSMVFFPEPPDAKAGEIKLIPDSKIKKLNIPVGELIKIIRKYGQGIASLLKEKN